MATTKEKRIREIRAFDLDSIKILKITRLAEGSDWLPWKETIIGSVVKTIGRESRIVFLDGLPEFMKNISRVSRPGSLISESNGETNVSIDSCGIEIEDPDENF